MLNENQIPDFVGSAVKDVRAWWDQVILLGLNTHPDDDPADIVELETGEPTLDASACKKILGIYRAMFDLFGDEVYEIGTAAYMNYLGYKVNPVYRSVEGADYWVRSA